MTATSIKSTNESEEYFPQSHKTTGLMTNSFSFFVILEIVL